MRLCDSVMERYRRHVYLLRRQILQGGSAARGRLLQRYFQASHSACSHNTSRVHSGHDAQLGLFRFLS